MIRIAMKLLQLKYFLTICEYSNISRAAGKLHVSQPSLTAAMKSLEQEFGITLFHRQSRGLILTEEGEIILLFPALVQSFHQAYPDARIQMVENGSVTNKFFSRRFYTKCFQKTNNARCTAPHKPAGSNPPAN